MFRPLAGEAVSFIFSFSFHSPLPRCLLGKREAGAGVPAQQKDWGGRVLPSARTGAWRDLQGRASPWTRLKASAEGPEAALMASELHPRRAHLGASGKAPLGRGVGRPASPLPLAGGPGGPLAVLPPSAADLGGEGTLSGPHSPFRPPARALLPHPTLLTGKKQSCSAGGCCAGAGLLPGWPPARPQARPQGVGSLRPNR